MRTIQVPDSLYVEAQRAAEATGVSLECFVREAVQLHLGDEQVEQALKLSPNQVAGLRKAQESIAAGNGMTMEQVERSLSVKKAAWQANVH